MDNIPVVARGLLSIPANLARGLLMSSVVQISVCLLILVALVVALFGVWQDDHSWVDR